MLWPILLTTYAAAAALYLAVALAYIGWRFWLQRKDPPVTAQDSEVPAQR